MKINNKYVLIFYFIMAINFMVLSITTGCVSETPCDPSPAMDRIQELGGAVKYDDHGIIISLSLYGTPASDEDLWILDCLPMLRCLDLRATAISDAVSTKLKHLKYLEEYKASSFTTDHGIGQLVYMKSLKKIDAGYTYISKNGIESLARVPNITYLRLSGLNINDSDLIPLTNMHGLQELDLSCTPVTDECANIITKLKKLDKIDLSSTSVSDKLVIQLVKHISMKCIAINGNNITDMAIDAIMKYNNGIVSLEVNEAGITNYGLKLLSHGSKLERISMARTAVGGEAMSTISAMPKLKHLDISGNKITDESMAALAKMDNLETLRVTDTLITGHGLRYLRECKNLKEVEIGGDIDVDYQAVEEFKDIRPNVRVIIKNRNVTK